MAKHPVSSSERRGIIVVAALALLIIGGALLSSRCSHPSSVEPPEVQVITFPDTLAGSDSLSFRQEGKRKARRDSTRKKHGKRKTNQQKAYPIRSPLDETI
ncbi:MAG: hypothetical protein K2J48_01330 [Muribaculaceae bacterium]|nr:hypothetical protein [Muribaculaceae bacterium]